MAGSAAHTITLAEDSYALLAREAQRRGIDVDVLAGELLRADLAPAQGDLESALTGLARLRDRLGEIDGLALARDARGELERRHRRQRAGRPGAGPRSRGRRRAASAPVATRR